MKICFISSISQKSSKLADKLIKKYKNYPAKECDVFVCLGGDGYMLHTMHNYLKYNKPFYGINCGTVGFLLNNIDNEIEKNLIKNIENSDKIVINPLFADITYADGNIGSAIAFNEIYIMRCSPITSHIEVSIDNKVVIEKLSADGALVSTAIGSTAYNMACGGSILPLQSNLICLTGINTFLPRNWKNVILPNHTKISLKNIDTTVQRKTNLYCDFMEFQDIKNATIALDKNKSITLLLDQNSNLENKLLQFQFK